MIKQIFFFITILFYSVSYSQTYKIDTLQYQGNGANVVNLVIMADGYTQDELAYFQEDAQRFTDYFFKTEPFRQYSNFFNVFAINTVSLESGAVHACTAEDCPKVEHNHTDLPNRFNKFPTRIVVPESAPNTIFGSSFDNGGIHRLVVPQKADVIEEVLKNHIPNYTQVVILVNSPFYGGSGGKFATATVNHDSNDIAVHEIGHSFALLADEYWAGNQYAYEGANRTQEADPKKVYWKHWVGVNDIGVYSYGGKNSPAKWFRPHEFCKMQYLVAPFCNVCQEVFVQTIHKKSSPIYKVYPTSSAVVDVKAMKKFSVGLLKPSPNTLRVRWYLNDQLLTSHVDSIYLNKGVLNNGENVLKVEVKDTTDLVRKPGYEDHVYTHEWRIQADDIFELDVPVSTWGDTLETCFNGYQALSVKNPQAGLLYEWFENETSKKAIATGYNWVTPRLKKDKVYYLRASFGKKVTPKKAVYLKVLPEIGRPESIDVKFINEKYTISVDETLANKYNLNWYSEDGKSIRAKKSKTEIEISKEKNGKKVYLELIDKSTTCRSEKFEIVL